MFKIYTTADSSPELTENVTIDNMQNNYTYCNRNYSYSTKYGTPNGIITIIDARHPVCDISGNGESVIFGQSYASGYDSTLNTSGIVSIFRYMNSEWVDFGEIYGETDQADSTLFGHTVSITYDGNRIAIGAPHYTINDNKVGAIYTMNIMVIFGFNMEKPY